VSAAGELRPHVSSPSARVLLAAAAPTRLTSLREKLELLAAHGVERAHVQRFSRSFAALAPEAFVEQVLAKRLRARWLLIGEDFRFGAKRAGDLALLKALGQRHGYEVETLPTVMHAGSRVSSSVVRAALAAGDLAAAETLLARTYSISGRVIHGRKLGRELGFATANVQLKHNRPPLTGIYAAKVHGVGARRALPSRVSAFGPPSRRAGARCWRCTCSISRGISTPRTCASNFCIRSATRRSIPISRP